MNMSKILAVLAVLFGLFLILQGAVDLSIPSDYETHRVRFVSFDIVSILLGAGILFRCFGKRIPFQKYIWTVFWIVVCYFVWIGASAMSMIALLLNISLMILWPAALFLLFLIGRRLKFDRVQWIILAVAIVVLFVVPRFFLVWR